MSKLYQCQSIDQVVTLIALANASKNVCVNNVTYGGTCDELAAEYAVNAAEKTNVGYSFDALNVHLMKLKSEGADFNAVLAIICARSLIFRRSLTRSAT